MIPSRFWRGVVTGLHLSSVLFKDSNSIVICATRWVPPFAFAELVCVVPTMHRRVNVRTTAEQQAAKQVPLLAARFASGVSQRGAS